MKLQLNRLYTLFVVLAFSSLITNLKAQCYRAFEGSQLPEQGLYTSIGEVSTDAFFIATCSELKSLFEVYPNFFFSESQGPYFETSSAFTPRIVYSKKFYKDQIAKSNGKERVKAVLAHEFAHAMQRKFEISWIQQKYAELHADYLAGFYVGKKGVIENNKLNSFANEFYFLGDTDFDDPDHHGTSEERRCAFLEGYKSAITYNFNIYQAFNCGVEYVRNLYPCKPFQIIKEYSKKTVDVKELYVITGGYKFETTKKNMVIMNTYGFILGDISPGSGLEFKSLACGRYTVYPGIVKRNGKIKPYPPIIFDVKPNHTSGFVINKVGLSRIKTYSIIF